jgi:radical SAM protein with 4Fe4S-binding SPASM domain
MSASWKGCQAGITVAAIQSNGQVKGCLSLSDEYAEGNIKEKPFTEIWNNPENFQYNRQFQTKDLNGGCKECRYGKKCRGGCMGVSLAETGMPHSDPYCFYLYEKHMGK